MMNALKKNPLIMVGIAKTFDIPFLTCV